MLFHPTIVAVQPNNFLFKSILPWCEYSMNENLSMSHLRLHVTVTGVKLKSWLQLTYTVYISHFRKRCRMAPFPYLNKYSALRWPALVSESGNKSNEKCQMADLHISTYIRILWCFFVVKVLVVIWSHFIRSATELNVVFSWFFVYYRGYLNNVVLISAVLDNFF